MKNPDEDDYGSYYSSSHHSGSSSGGVPRYRYSREYSPNRHHQRQQQEHQQQQQPQQPQDHYQIPSGSSRGYNSSSSSRSSQSGSYIPSSSRNIAEYAAPPCCHQFYHSPNSQINSHSHFNTIPHPPLQYRDLPTCSTLNRSCYGKKHSNNPYSTTYYESENPYSDPRNDIYSFSSSTLSRHPRHDVDRLSSSNSGRHSSSRSSSSSSNFPHSHHHHHQDIHQDPIKIYDTPPPPPGFQQTSSKYELGPSLNLRSYAPPPPILQPSQQNSSLLRVEDSRVYSSPALQYVSSGGIGRDVNLGIGGSNSSNLHQIRSTSPQQNFIDSRSISLIRLDNNSNNGTLGDGGHHQNGAHLLNHHDIGSCQTRIKFQPQDTSSLGAVGGIGPSTLIKSTIELGGSHDPLSTTPIKSKYGLLTGALIDNNAQHHMKQQHHIAVEFADKAVMTSSSSQHPEQQWSLLNTSSGSGGSNERRISGSDGLSPSNQPQTSLSGGIPDLLPTCVVRNNDYAWNSAPSPSRRNYGGDRGHHGPSSSSIDGPGRGVGGGVGGSGRGSKANNGSRNRNMSRGDDGQNLNGELGESSRWSIVKKYIRGETKIFFGLKDSEDLKEEWFSRRKRFASRRYSERNVDSMPPPSPYRRYHQQACDQVDGGGRIPTMDPRPLSTASLLGRSRRRKKDNVFVVYWNLLIWLFWTIRFGRTGQRVAAGAGCGADYNSNPGSGSSSPGRVNLNSQMSRDRSKSRSVTPNTLAEIPQNISSSPQDLFFDDYDDMSRNSVQIQPPGRGLHWRISRHQQPGGGHFLTNRIPTQILSKVLDNSERQRYRQNHLRQSTSSFSKLGIIDEYEDFRPYFTWWMSTVHTIILIASVITYGFAPFGLDLHRKSSLVLVTSLSLQQMEIIAPANFWIGNTPNDLVHLGAKFAPCMRLDEQIHRRIIETRDRERNTACCIRNDNSGCVQSSRNECSGLLSTWKKWTREEGPGGRISGSVCGLDPKFCEAPASIAPYEWPDDITKWPICRRTRGLSGMSTKDKTAEHMVCEVIGHPCCIGIHAKCLITTREYCRFVNGYFHEEASLCSQVSCLQDVCGLFPFLSYEHPDQFYRLFTSLFLHAGFGHLFLTLCFHFFIMRDLEKLAGPLRIAIIYFGSGIAGNLASVILEPHRAEVGPGGGQYGLIACLLVELLHMWCILKRPWYALGKMLLLSTVLFLLGFLPWIDNFAHAAGFVAGLLLCHASMPYISFGKYSTYRKWLEIVICLGMYFAFTIALLIVFYAGFGDCEICRYFNCLPLTQDFCAEQDIDFKPSGSGINLIT